MTLIQKLLLGNQAPSLSQMLLGSHPASSAQLNDLGLWKTTSLGVVRAATSNWELIIHAWTTVLPKVILKWALKQMNSQKAWSQNWAGLRFLQTKRSLVYLFHILRNNLPNYSVMPACVDFYNANLVYAHSFAKILLTCVQPSKMYGNHKQNFLQILKYA